MKLLLVTIFVFFLNFSIPAASRELINKAIICKEINNDFKSMYGFNFIDEDSVQILIKNSDTVDVLIDNILEYNTTKDIIYIIGFDNNNLINYGFNIFRDDLKVWAFNVTALEPFFGSDQCEVFNNIPKEFKPFFKSIFKDEIKSSFKIKKI